MWEWIVFFFLNEKCDCSLFEVNEFEELINTSIKFKNGILVIPYSFKYLLLLLFGL
jgi:hypothetical protein